MIKQLRDNNKVEEISSFGKAVSVSFPILMQQRFEVLCDIFHVPVEIKIFSKDNQMYQVMVTSLVR